MPAPSPQAQIVKEAWIGDAVLTLYARLKILREDGRLDGEKSIRMTSNRFLSGIGEPASVEAEVGRVYERQGLEVASAWIETNLIPLFDRQEENRSKNSQSRNRR
ncbi:MAG TPA: hypothetical protein VHZ07_16095 [Bryobacteraceae bacterium]|jgi:hypothetical protein|nr:hypothetical protein [Bryobacteraceae bacterium]